MLQFSSKKHMIDMYDKQKPALGSGSFGTVYRYVLKSKHKGFHPALVVVKKIPITESKRVLIERELQILTETSHDNIVKFFSFFISRSTMNLVLEHCDMTLTDLIAKNEWKKEDSNQVKPLGKKIVGGLDYLHKMDIIHRDVKPDNILINVPNKMMPLVDIQSIVVKISDFGLSRFIDKRDKKAITTAGTQVYMSPEMARAYNDRVKFVSPDNWKTDVFSAGIVLYEMWHKQRPYTITQLPMPSQQTPRHVSRNAVFQDLCVQMLTWPVDGRIKLADVVEHPFFA